MRVTGPRFREYEAEGPHANDDSPRVENSELGFRLLDSQNGLNAIFKALGQLGAEHGAVIKMQTWRGDEVGLKAAKSCEEALGRGAEIKLFKDQIGATFELGEREGRSFWHQRGENPKLETQAHWLGKFYGREEAAPDVDLELALADSRQALHGFSAFNVSGGYRYDHSKLVLIYDKRTKQPIQAFIGGANFGNEWGDQVADQNFDGVVEINDPVIL